MVPKVRKWLHNKMASKARKWHWRPKMASKVQAWQQRSEHGTSIQKFLATSPITWLQSQKLASKIRTWAWIGAKDQYMVLEAIIWLQRLWLSFKDQNWVPEVEIGFQGPVMALQALLQINIIMLTFHFSSYKFHIKSKCM